MFMFDGNAEAQALETELRAQISSRQSNAAPIRIVAILFREDAGSQLYTRLKSEMAARLGIEYVVESFSFTDEAARVVATIDRSNRDWQVTGIIVQKPSRSVWKAVTSRTDMEYQLWWHTLMGAVSPEKDVDGLHPQTIASIQEGTWKTEQRLLPATCQAVLFALEKAKQTLKMSRLGKTLILGKSDLVGLPLYAVLSQQEVQVELLGLKDFLQRKEQKSDLLDGEVIISATGKPNLITPESVREGVVLVDVGEPRGDIAPETYSKGSFVTPVPGGIGPLTVIFLMKNAVALSVVKEPSQ